MSNMALREASASKRRGEHPLRSLCFYPAIGHSQNLFSHNNGDIECWALQFGWPVTYLPDICHIFTQPQYEAKKFYTWKFINLRQKLSRNKAVCKMCISLKNYTVCKTFSRLENFTLGSIFHTSSSYDGCDKYQVWWPIFFLISHEPETVTRAKCWNMLWIFGIWELKPWPLVKARDDGWLYNADCPGFVSSPISYEMWHWKGVAIATAYKRITQFWGTTYIFGA